MSKHVTRNTTRTTQHKTKGKGRAVAYMKVVNHILATALDWYLLRRIGWGTGSRPTRVVLRRYSRIWASSAEEPDTSAGICGTIAASSRMMGTIGSDARHDSIHSAVGTNAPAA